MVKRSARGQSNAGTPPIDICVVEDDPDLREELVSALSNAGLSVRAFPGSRELYASLLAAPCDIVILDIGLPGEDGFSIAERLHGLGTMGIVMLTARDGSEDRVRALTGGADCYLLKPVVIPELLAALNQLASRLPSRQDKQDAAPASNGGSWTLATNGWTVLAPNGASFPLTAQERKFLARLWQCPGEPVSREELAAAMGEDPYEFDFHRFDTLVNRLRQKATQQNLSLPLRTVRGKGYLILPH